MTVADSGSPAVISLPPLYVLGLGLIGGSLLRAAAPFTAVAGWSPSPQTRGAAAADGFEVLDTLDDTIRRAADEDGLLVLASPLTTFAPLLARIAELAPTVKLTDVGSVKGVVADQVEDLCPEARYIGSHPMAGTASSGWSAGSATLFGQAAWVTCLDEISDLPTWTEVASLALAVGSRVIPAEAIAHDEAVARISHLPHMLALALAQVGAAGGSLALSLAASSFNDATRVAGTRPELIRAMCEANKKALVTAVDDALGILGVARGSLASTGSLQKLTSGGHEARSAFDNRGSTLVPLTLSGEDMIDQLISVGSAGGHVTGIVGSGDDLQVHVRYPREDED
ncbi:prephenate dehydrogenase [Nakamurella sp. UYEF19]|uniref:prephenate dehydrogenase n=1 Tax=Nakamurella sp. UYEF19 TaxID=1756392 RepID=UPI0033997462